MLFPPKNCYRLSSYYFSVVCFVAAGILFSIAYISGLFRNHLIFAVPLIGVCAFFCICGIFKGSEVYQFRKKCHNIKTHGKRYHGIVKNFHCRKAMVEEKFSDAYSFLVSYFAKDENVQKEFWTPVVDFCPFDTQKIECIVYEYNGEAYAEDFKGWERKGDDNKTSEFFDWLPIVIVFTILIILFFTMN